LNPIKGVESAKGQLENVWVIAIPRWVVERLGHFRFARRNFEWTYLLGRFHLIEEES
jgi:hypothetical protein